VDGAPLDGVPEPRGAEAVGEGDQADADQESGDQAGAEAYARPRLPYDDGVFLAHHLIRKMPDSAFDRMLELLNEHQRQRDAVRQGSA
jgi:ParB family chromosome partitioning protein